MTDERAECRHRTFIVSAWSEEVGEAVEHRGRVREVDSGAFRSFRRWSELNAFLAERLLEPAPAEECT